MINFSRSRGRLTALALVACTMSALSACGAGFDSAVDEVRAENAGGDLNGILARDVVVVKGTAATAAALAGTLINRGRRADTLQTVSLTDNSPGSATVTVSPNLALAPGQLIGLGAESHQPITIPDAHAITLGHFVDVVFHFASAGDMRLNVATADRSLFYSAIAPVLPSAIPGEADAPGHAAYTSTLIVTDNPAKAAPKSAAKAKAETATRPTPKPTTKPAADAVRPAAAALKQAAPNPAAVRPPAPKAAPAKPAAAAPKAQPAAVAPADKPDPAGIRPQAPADANPAPAAATETKPAPAPK